MYYRSPMKRPGVRWVLFAVCVLATRPSPAQDWPQFMRDARRSGDAPEETLRLPLKLSARVDLGDVVMASPAVVGDSAFVVDQMGTAARVAWRTGRIVWKASPDGDRAMGSNTSSPCVAGGRVYFGTTAGTFHVLDAETGRTIKTVDVGWPIVASPAFANESIYVQTVGAVVHCFDLDGDERWR